MSPNGLALDPQGNIHVAAVDFIKVFTKEGVYVRTYGGPGAGGMEATLRPWGIAIDDEGNACVIDERYLSIFDHHGNKLHKVGSLSDPCGIALDIAIPEMVVCIYVADPGAYSVLKYSAT